MRAAAARVGATLLPCRYEDCFRLADSCVTDSELSAEEAQLWECLEYAGSDVHPDAHACRLKLSLAVMGSESVLSCPWRVAFEMEAYVLKVGHVSPGCRLSIDEEVLLLERSADGSQASVELRNRLALLWALKQGAAVVELEVPPRPSVPCFDAVTDASCLDEGARTSGSMIGSFFDAANSRLSAVTYSRPESCAGALAPRAPTAVRGHSSYVGVTSPRASRGAWLT